MIKTASRENCERLYELGLRAGSYFSWWLTSSVDGEESYYVDVTDRTPAPFHAGEEAKIICPAWTADELAEVLPDEIRQEGTRYEITLTSAKEFGLHYCSCSPIDDLNLGKPILQADTMADAIALMLIWLIENGHLEVEDKQ